MNRLLLVITVFLTTSVHAVVFQLSLDGTGGQGMLPTNENHAVTAGGTGGIGGGGITYDDQTGVLFMDVEWGSENGHTDLSGPATAAHIHGATATPFGFTENAGVKYDLSSVPAFNFLTSATGGALFGNVQIAPGDESALLSGQFYINVHTSLNSGGEIRGQLVATAVPEPRAYALLVGMACVGGACLRRRFCIA